MSVSDFCQLAISAAALLEYVVEGCDLLGCGLEGLRGIESDGVEVVAQPVSSSPRTSSVSQNASLTGGGQLASFVSTILATLLQRSSLEVCRSLRGVPFTGHTDGKMIARVYDRRQTKKAKPAG